MNHDETHHPAREHGFDLRSVSWGYRRIFADTIRQLLAEGSLGPGRAEVTATFFEMLKRSQPGSFDFALKEFLGALNPQTKWLLELPRLFEDFCTLGRELAEDKLAYGIAFFRQWGAGGFGRTPQQLSALLNHVRRLRKTDPELAQAFLLGYGRLLDHLDADQLRLFVRYLQDVYRASPRTAIDSAGLRLKSAMAFVRNLTQEARLDELTGRLERLARAVAGRTVAVRPLGELDSDPLIERGAMVVCFADHLYLPVRIRCCRPAEYNEALYLLATVASAQAVGGGSFPAVHGRGGAGDVVEWLAAGDAAAGLLTIVETVRVLEALRRRMPGVARLIDFGIAREFALRPPATATDRLMQRCLGRSADGDEPLVRDIRSIAAASEDVSDTAGRLGPLVERFARAGDAAPRALMFFPDFYFPASVRPAPAGRLVADLARRVRRQSPEEQGPAGDEGRARPAEDEAAAVPAAFVYPEWNHRENDYYEDWCFLRERRSRADGPLEPARDAETQAAARRARRMFERLKPQLARREKLLAFGDEINLDRLVEYMALRRRLPAPRVRFYEKTFIRRRDLAVALLLDVSGSTAGRGEGDHAPPPDAPRIIDLEKRAALTLSEGLDALGDAFALYGFSGNGREHCDFFVYKDLDEDFSDDCRRRLLAAQPVASTRIGVALRHCRTKLAASPARKKLIILITDGRPQDAGYDPTTRYAQYDVRMACEECRRREIQVVCISTLANSRSDLEIMFPQRRFVVLEDMSQLSGVLPALYLKMTT